MSCARPVPLSRRDAQGVPGPALKNVMTVDASKLPVYTGLGVGDRGYAIYRVTKVVPGEFKAGAQSNEELAALNQQAGAEQVESYIASLRFLMKFVPEEKTDQHVIAWLTARSGSALKVLDRHLFTQEWVAADHITIADLSCVGYLYYDHEFGHDLTSFQNIERWRQAIAALPGWKHPYDLMPGHPIPAGALS